MMTFVLVVTLLCLAVPIYVYAGYPALLWLFTLRPDGAVFGRVPAEASPSVTLIVSCYNEAGVIGQKLENALALDYPKGRLSIMVVSDGSDDGTDELVRAYEPQGVCLIRQEVRQGKTMGLNLALAEVSSDLVVFSDANAMYAPDAITRLVRHFSDPNVGYVVGAALYTDATEGASAAAENRYWRYEIAIKQMESRLHSVVGGDGAIYAIRRALWQPLLATDINDFVNPLQIVARGYRGVFDPEARCFEETAGDFSREAARKERIVNRSIRGLMRVKSAMNPWKTGIFAWQLVSHKLLRWLIPLFLLIAGAGSVVLAWAGYSLFQAVTAAIVVVLALALVGHLAGDRNRLPTVVSVPYYFVMVNLFALRGIVRALRGQTQITWQTARPAQRREQG